MIKASWISMIPFLQANSIPLDEESNIQEHLGSFPWDGTLKVMTAVFP